MSLLTRMAMALLPALTLAGHCNAHEMFLRPDKAQAAAQSNQQVRLITGTFDKSENSITRDRMAKVSLLAGGQASSPPLSDWSDDDKKTLSVLSYKTGAPGTYVIGVSTKPSIISMSAKDFISYLKHDGVVDTLAEFSKGAGLATVRERYSKHVRTYVQVGDSRTDDYAKPLGYPVEILLEKNPFELRRGDKLSFRVLVRGKPVANQLVRASHEGFHGHDAKGGHLNAAELRTDADGRASFVVSKQANWYLSLIHMEKITDTAADYESNWATATFRVN